MKRFALLGVLAVGLATAVPAAVSAQDPPPLPDLLDVGQMAPDVEVTGATRYGIIEQPVRLSQLRGEAVVLAFFFRARTRG